MQTSIYLVIFLSLFFGLVVGAAVAFVSLTVLVVKAASSIPPAAPPGNTEPVQPADLARPGAATSGALPGAARTSPHGLPGVYPHKGDRMRETTPCAFCEATRALLRRAFLSPIRKN